MAQALNGAVTICYEEFGSDEDPLLVLIPGLGSQMLLYPEELCLGFVDRGFRVARIDNRDVGHSSRVPEGYSLVDMADDVVSVLDECQIDIAHIAGMSMGGIIAQTVAAQHPARTRTLTSIASTTGNPSHQQPSPEVMEALLEPTVDGTIDEIIEADLAARALWASPEWHDVEATRDYFRASYERSAPDGAAYQRQLDAVTAAGNRDDEVASINRPSLVIHGTDDTLIPPAAGEHTAATIDGAELVLIEGMGHDLPVQMWAQLISSITGLASRAV
ncbi:MAG: alpha/beta fold hydrolase [Acidimicrobiales bacterium]